MKNNNWLIGGLMSLVLLIGGVGVPNSLALKAGGGLVFMSLVVTFLMKHKKLDIPKGWRVWIVFWLYSLVAVWGSQNPYAAGEWQILWLVSTVCWLVGYNSVKKNELVKMIVGLGGVFLLAAIILTVFGEKQMSTLSLVEWATKDHHHLGDWWSLVVVAIIGYQGRIKNRGWRWGVIMLGIVIIAWSRSRSAVVAMLGGVGYLWWSQEIKGIKERGLGWIMVVMASIFLGIGVRKTTIFSRLFYLEAIQGLMRNPWGVGMGSFREVSSEFSRQVYYSKEVWSSYVHNLPLEVLIGVGVVGGGFFLLWLVGRIREVGTRKGGVTEALWIAALINMFFDYTYMIPAYLWVWFIMLGVWQREIEDGDKITQ